MREETLELQFNLVNREASFPRLSRSRELTSQTRQISADVDMHAHTKRPIRPGLAAAIKESPPSLLPGLPATLQVQSLDLPLRQLFLCRSRVAENMNFPPCFRAWCACC